MAKKSEKAKAPLLRIDKDLRKRLRAALAEDIRNGDATSMATIGARARGSAVMKAKADGVVSGLTVARAVFQEVDASLRCKMIARDGDYVAPGDVLMTVSGRLRSVLSGERVALNFLQRLSGVATLTSRFALAVEGTNAGVYDTRKTTPLWRDLERHAVVCGGGRNHRYCLDDMILIKDNHVDAAGSVSAAVEQARAWRRDSKRRIEIMAETRTLDEIRQALEAGADYIMVDNMTLAQTRRALEIVGGRVPVESSGNVTPLRAEGLARAGVDRISVGALTHSAPALDISLTYQDAD